MKRILLTLSYNGSAYHGWQIQPNGITVQQTLQNALLRVLGREISVSGCSRTDAGVHAKMFCCHFDCDDGIPADAFLRGLNSVLPNDIAVTDVNEVPFDFHSRFNAKGKTYVYYIFNTGKKDPFVSPFVWQLERPLNVEIMNEFCKKIVGTHDFYGFSSSGRTVENTVRTVSDCLCFRDGDFVKLQITADGFLYNMVRIITGTAVDVSLGRLSVSCADEVFATKKRELAGITAPPQGLFLEKVYY